MANKLHSGWAITAALALFFAASQAVAPSASGQSYEVESARRSVEIDRMRVRIDESAKAYGLQQPGDDSVSSLHKDILNRDLSRLDQALHQ